MVSSLRLRSVLSSVGARVLRPIRPPGRDVKIRDDDRFIVSYPRSGSTWVRFLVSGLLSGRDPDFQSIRQTVPDIYLASRRQLRSTSLPRILKSHEALDLRYPLVLYLVRDPRDVVVSYFHYHVRLGVFAADTGDMRRFVNDFLDGRLDAYGAWDLHVARWLERCRTKGWMVLRYEDLKSDPAASLTNIIEALKLGSYDAVDVNRAVVAAAPERMRQLDRLNVARGGGIRGVRPGYDFVRSAESGRGVRELTDDLCDAVIERFSGTMSKLGYLESKGGSP